MKKLVCLFSILLPISIWPIFLRVPAEITPVYKLIETDIFSWYRMWAVIIFGIVFYMAGAELTKTLWAFFVLVCASTLKSEYIRTSAFGAPWMHEGFLAIIGYIGIYLIIRKYGLFKELEKSIDAAILIIFISCLIQLKWGNVFELRIFKWLNPTMQYEFVQWPLFGFLGNGNHLGLFTALTFPYAVIKKKPFLTAAILSMAVGSIFRGAWLAIIATTLLVDKKTTIKVFVMLLLISVPMHRQVIPRVKRTFQEINYPIKDTDLSGRAYIWKCTIPRLNGALLLGYGPATYAMYFPQNEQRGKDAGFDGLTVDRPHNMYLNTWLGTGFLSLSILLISIATILYRAKDQALKLSCIGFLIAGFFTDSVLSVTPYFVIFLGALSYEYNEKRRHDERAGLFSGRDWLQDPVTANSPHSNYFSVSKSSLSTESN